MTTRKEFKSRVMALKGMKCDMFCDYFGVRTDWCAMFVSYCMKNIANISWFPKTTSCSSMKNSLYERVNHDFKTAEVGDIILFETVNPKDGPDHVGIVVDNSNGIITLIEGNTGNSNFSKSSVGVYKYPYEENSFDCIIDMSSEFGELDEIEKYRNAINAIKEILSKL